MSCVGAARHLLCITQCVYQYDCSLDLYWCRQVTCRLHGVDWCLVLRDVTCCITEENNMISYRTTVIRMLFPRACFIVIPRVDILKY